MDNQTIEQALRQEAIRRRLEGERRCDICDDLQRSLRWFSKWWAEYQCNPQMDFSERSRAPHRSATQLPEPIELAIVNVRLTLEAADCGLIGRQAIQHELAWLQVKPLPSLTAIQRVLAEHGLTHARGDSTDIAYYPELIAWAPNAIHASDIITRHLYGGEVVQNFHTFDHYSHAVHLSQYADKSSRTACGHLLENWATLGLPAVQQLDNENAFSGGHTHPRVIGRVVRSCLFVGTEVLFDPEYEPERNYWVEGFHSLWLQAFWSRQTFHDRAAVQAQVPNFAHWYHHRYHPPSLQGHTPAQMRHGFQPLQLSGATRRLIPEPLPITAGRIHFMRKVDGDGTIRLLNESWPIGPKWIGAYVCATVDTGQQSLSIWSKPDATAPWHHIKTRVFKLPQPVQPLLPIFRRKRARCLEHWPG
jgi:hypothetical protein